jgi:membrane associated rhomboid family serine protease
MMVVGFFVQLIAAWYAGVGGVKGFDQWVYFSARNFLSHPWTLFSYVFFHADLEHFFWNLVIFGYVYFYYRDCFTNRLWILTWLLGSAVGAVVFAIAQSEIFLLGSSTALWALLGFSFWYELHNLKGKWNGNRVVRVILFFVLLFGQFYFSDEKVAIRSHLGGMLTGIFIGIFQNSKGMGLWKKFVEWIPGSPKLTVKRSNARFKTDDEFNTERKLKEDYLNSILEKIARSGYDSLSQKERTFLENQSEK